MAIKGPLESFGAKPKFYKKGDNFIQNRQGVIQI